MQASDGGEKARAHGASKAGVKEALDEAARRVPPHAVGKTFRVVNMEVVIGNPRIDEYRVDIEER